MKSSYLLLALGAAQAKITTMPFKDLESSTTQKLVIFHDPGNEKSGAAIEILKKLDEEGGFGGTYEWKYCDVTAPENVEPVKEAGFKNFPQVFTQTVEDGISPFHGDFTFETFKAFHAFRTLEIKEHKMVPFTTHAAANALAEEQPVFLKLFEEWCPHCKKMKKHFQALSNEVDDITMMEVECSKTEASKEFCAKIGSTGFPTVKLLSKGKTHKYEGGRILSSMKSFLQAKKFDFTETVAGVDEAAPVSEADKKKQEEAAAGEAEGEAPPPYDPNGPQSPPYAEGGDAAADHKAAGIAYDEAGDLKNAILAFGAAAKFAPESGAAWNNLAWALDAFSESPMFIFKMDEAKQAAHTTKVMEAFAKAAALDPTNTEAAEQAAAIGEKAAAARLAAATGLAKAAYNEAIRLDEAGNIAGAVAAFRKVTEHTPLNPKAWHNLCMALSDEENPAAGKAYNTEELLQVCQKAVELNPANEDAKEELQRAQEL